jgi:hypothetical protein
LERFRILTITRLSLVEIGTDNAQALIFLHAEGTTFGDSTGMGEMKPVKPF